MKKGPFKLKSGNKPSMAQLSGVSPMKEMVDKGAGKGKVNPFSAEYKRMTKSQREKKYGFKTTKEGIKQEKIIGSGKTGKIGNIGTALQNIVKSVTGDKKNKGNGGGDDNSNKVTKRSRFETAFAKARKEGLDIFEFEGKKYTTKTK